MRGWPVGLVFWLLLLGCLEAVGIAGMWEVFVRSAHGQHLDFVALSGSSIGEWRINGAVNTILNTISVVSLIAATVVIGFVALIRRRVALAFGAVLLIGGASLSAQLLKQFIVRPDLGVDPERSAAGNSLPSGHSAIAASVAVAMVLVLPARVRGVGAIIGAVFAAVAGVATLSAAWHRPSDAVTSLLLVGAWAALASVVIVSVQRRHGGVEYGHANKLSTGLLALAGLALLVGAAVALKLTDGVIATPVGELSRTRLLVAYAGGAMGVAGTAGLVFAAVLATAHRVAPRVIPAAEDGAVEEDPRGVRQPA